MTVVLCPLSDGKGSPKSEDNGTMETRTFIAQIDGEVPGMKEGVQAMETSQIRGRWYGRSNVHCDQDAAVMVESRVENGGDLMSVVVFELVGNVVEHDEKGVHCDL